MDVSPADIKLILSTLQDSEFDQAEVVIGDVRIAVARNGMTLDAVPAAETVKPVIAASAAAEPITAPAAVTPTTAASAVVAPVAAATPSQSAHTVESPSVGVFWRASSPGAAPFVEVGQEVTAGDTIGIVEMMKLMNNVAAGVDGVVTAIHIDNGGSVEFGTPLVTIEPKA